MHLHDAALVAQAADGRTVRAREELQKVPLLLWRELVHGFPEPADGLQPPGLRQQTPNATRGQCRLWEISVSRPRTLCSAEYPAS